MILFETIRTDVPLSNEPSILQSNVHHSNKPMLNNVPQSNESFQTIPTDVPFSNESMLTNVPLSIEPKLIIGNTEPSAEFQFEPQPKQVKDLMDFWFKSAVYTEDLYDFSKEFKIGGLYRDRIVLKNYIKAYAVENKFNLVHVLSNKYKIVMRGSFERAYQLLTSYFAEVRNAGIINVVPKVFSFAIHTFCDFHISNNIKTTLESMRVTFRMAVEALTNILINT
ncbi:hypothetical protein GIB67_023607 [Kingdonia uniflora]|uniref:Uncharacterized protein n=1 Tax=Kingdonia uniflora TaxID=39325 RepID=A0A7J7L505_9MAGN|nr:hypothetical protein GIB67_023607 [Kingdonia uniflora]